MNEAQLPLGSVPALLFPRPCEPTTTVFTLRMHRMVCPHFRIFTDADTGMVLLRRNCAGLGLSRSFLPLMFQPASLLRVLDVCRPFVALLCVCHFPPSPCFLAVWRVWMWPNGLGGCPAFWCTGFEFLLRPSSACDSGLLTTLCFLHGVASAVLWFVGPRCSWPHGGSFVLCAPGFCHLSPRLRFHWSRFPLPLLLAHVCCLVGLCLWCLWLSWVPRSSPASFVSVAF